MTEDIPAPVTNGFEEKAREVLNLLNDSYMDANPDEAVSAISTALEEAVTEARLQEREACAQLAESAFLYSDVRTSKASSERIATAIRNRK